MRILKKIGKFDEAYLGIFAYDKQLAVYADSKINLDNGVYVANVSSDGPSNLSQIKIGDIITKIDNADINKMSDLRRYIYTKKPGDEVELRILRNKKEFSVNIKLGQIK